MIKALVVVDVQKDFCPGGALAVPKGDEVVSEINKLIADQFGFSSGNVVVYSQDWHPANHSSFKPNGGIWPVHCVAETKGADLHPDLYKIGPTFLKGFKEDEDSYSAFGGVNNLQERKPLHSHLQLKFVEEVLIVGLALDYCVKATAIEAKSLGYKTKVILDGTRAVNVNLNDGLRAIKAMKALGIEVI